KVTDFDLWLFFMEILDLKSLGYTLNSWISYYFRESKVKNVKLCQGIARLGKRLTKCTRCFAQ
ncbi:hypothetical protein CWO92_20550, partial [Heyndrickxia camelliae]